MGEITQQLTRISQGDRNALDALVPLVYDELRALARRHMRSERPDHTLSPTALVNEVYLRLATQRQIVCHNRGEFFAIASRYMRRVLVDFARRRNAKKRGSDPLALELPGSPAHTISLEQVLVIDEALEHLAERNPRLPIVVDLMFFGGFTQAEIAETLEVSVSTVKKDWSISRAWLTHELGEANGT